jgi:hypothetical protein
VDFLCVTHCGHGDGVSQTTVCDGDLTPAAVAERYIGTSQCTNAAIALSGFVWIWPHRGCSN